MRRVGDTPNTHPTPTTAKPSVDPLIQKGLRKKTAVSAPLDVLHNLSPLAARSIERRPPKMPLTARRRRKDNPGDSWDIDLGTVQPSLSKDTSEVAYEVVELVLRRRNEISVSGDAGAQRGMAALEELCRMFEHVYLARTGQLQRAAKS